MKKYAQATFMAVFAATALLAPSSAHANLFVALNVTNPTNTLFDASTVLPLQLFDVSVQDLDASIVGNIEFTQDGAGKLKGSGVTSVEVNSPVFQGTITNATYKVSGTVTSKSGITKVTYNATMMAKLPYNGKLVNVTATATRSVTLNALTGLGSGRGIDKISAAGLASGSETSDFSDQLSVIPGLGSGAWNLSVDLNDAKTGGTAKVTGNTGAEYDFKVKGAVKNGKANLTLSADPASPGSKGSSLKVVVDTALNTIQSFSGKVSGQTMKQ